MLSAYPFLCPEKPDYALYVALWCNLSRTLLRQAWAVKMGIEMAFSKERLPRSIFTSLYTTEEEADTAYEKDEDARIRAVFKAGGGLNAFHNR